MTSEEDVKNAIQTAKDKSGRLDNAVSCAGIAVALLTYNAKKDRVHDLADFQKILNVSILYLKSAKGLQIKYG